MKRLKFLLPATVAASLVLFDIPAHAEVVNSDYVVVAHNFDDGTDLEEKQHDLLEELAAVPESDMSFLEKINLLFP